MAGPGRPGDAAGADRHRTVLSWLARQLLWEPQPAVGGQPRPRCGLLLVPVLALTAEVLDRGLWAGYGSVASQLAVVVLVVVLALVAAAPAAAADLALAGLIAVGLYVLALAAVNWLQDPVPTPYGGQVRYGAASATLSRPWPWTLRCPSRSTSTCRDGPTSRSSRPATSR